MANDGTEASLANASDERPSAGAPTKTSEITIVMRTVLSSAAVNNGSATKATGGKSDTESECPAERPPTGNRIEVTTSVKTVLECPDAAPSADSCAEAAAIGLMLQPVLSKNFIALLKSANDSSFENVLEFKSLLTGAGRSAGPADSGELLTEPGSKHGLSSDSDTTAHDESALKKPKTKADPDGDDFARLPSSTPIRIRISQDPPCLVEKEVDDEQDYRLDLLTPPADASFIDSDFESMEQDQYDTCSSKGSSRHDSLHPPATADSCRQLSSPSPTRGDHHPPAAEVIPDCPEAVRSHHRKSSSVTKAFFEEALKTPLAIRKHFQKRRNSELPKQSSHGNLLHFFSAKKKSNSLEGGLKSPRAKRSLTAATASENSSESGSRCTSPALTEDNLRRLSVSIFRADSDCLNRTLVWGENYDYSYECEPSHSDVEEEDEEEGEPLPSPRSAAMMAPGGPTQRRTSTKLVHFDVSPDSSSFELQPPIVPSFRIDPPRAGLLVGCGLMGAVYASALATTVATTPTIGFLKRSVSDPVNCKVRSHSCTPLTSDIGESDEDVQGRPPNRVEDDEDVPTMRAALVPLRPFTSVHQASVRSLDKIGVSAPNLLEGIHDDGGTDEGKQINHNASPFRRWGQSSLRSRSTEHRTPISSARRPSSLAASESDVYTKSIDDDYSSTKSGYNPYGDMASTGVLAPEVTVTGPGSASGIVATAGGPAGGPAGVASWGTSFEKLLEDAGGLHTFSEFLKKEFSAENIYFWTACERYRQLAERDERAREAQAIFAKHLESGCSEPVNVDSIARNIALENLPQAEPTLFAAAQKQIFNLMKFDSYQRFIKSDMYRVCQEAEAKGQPLPYPGEQLDPLLRTSSLMAPSAGGAMTKLKKSLSNAEDRRRKSLLPWHRKTRCKSKDRGDSDASKKDSGKGATSAGHGHSASGGGGGGSSSNTLKLLSTNSTSDIHSSRSSLASFDAAIGGKSYDPDDSRNTLCRVILSNGATTVVQTRSNETIKELVERLLEKRGIVYNAYEAFLAGSTKPLDLDGPSVSLAGKEVNIDQRVVFKLNLPNRKMISVKSKATKPLGDVLRPILYKYSYELDQMRVYSTDVYLELTHPVTTVDGLCLYIRAASDAPSTAGGSIVHPELGRTLAGARPVINTATHQQIVHHFQQQQQQQQQQQLLTGPPSSSVPQQHNFVVPSSVLPSGTSNVAGAKNVSAFANGLATASALCNNNNLLSVNQNHLRAKEQQEALKDEHGGGRPQELNTLDEITNKVFNELMNGKTGNNAVAGGKGGGPPDVDCASDTSSSRRDRFRRRGSNAPSESGRGAKSKKCSTGGSEDGGESVNNLGLKKPIIAKLKAGVKLQMPTRSQNDELLEGLKRAQRSRLEDQRGTEINFELPDFLKDKENLSASVAPVAGGSNGSAAPAPSKLTRSKPARRSETGTPTAEFGGSLQQINKPQPAPRLSITGQQQQQHHRGSGYGSPVQTAVSDSHLNLSTQCNASPNPLDDPFHAPVGGSQSENSYADTTLVFTHATSGQSPTAPTIRALHALSDDQSDASGDGNAGTTRAAVIAANGCCDHPADASPGTSPSSHSTHLHPHHYHHTGASATGASGSVNSTVASATAYHTHYPLLHHHHHHHPHGQHYHHHPGRYQATVLPNGVGSSDSHPGSNVDSQRGPPPLPPKPKILPIKPSNWGHPSTGVASSGAGSSDAHSTSGLSSSPSSSNHSTPSSNGGGGMVGTGETNGILSTNNTEILGSTTREPGRRVANGGTEGIGGTTGGPTVISSVVAQARSIYFDQGNSSFV